MVIEMLYVNFEDINIPEDWKDRADRKLTSLKLKTKKTVNDSTFWGELRPAFADMHGEKCWYCENKISGSVPQIEHFRPKAKVKSCNDHKGYWWLAYECTNYRFSCSICNDQAHKGNHFPLVDEKKRAYTDTCDCGLEDYVFLDPFIKGDCESLTCNIIEHIMIAKPGSNNPRAQSTINIFGLDKEPHISNCGSVLKTLQGFLSYPEKIKIDAITNYLKNTDPGYPSFIQAFLEENDINVNY